MESGLTVERAARVLESRLGNSALSDDLVRLSRCWASSQRSDSPSAGSIGAFGPSAPKKTLTAETALALSELQIMTFLDVPWWRAKELLVAIASVLAPDLCTTFELLEEEREIVGWETVFTSMGILRKGKVTEIVGRAGSGKTQFCMKSCVDAVVGNVDKCAVYIDTENKFSVSRTLEMIQNRIHKNEASVRDLASKILVFKPQNMKALVKIVDGLESVLIEKNAGLLVLDSIAAFAQNDFKYGGNIVRRQQTLAKLAAKLKFFAESCNLPVLVTNQVVTASNSTDPSLQIASVDRFAVNDFSSLDSNASSTKLVSVLPALGNTWSHCVNMRIVFEVLSDTHATRRAKLVKAPHLPEIEVFFKISMWGIEEISPADALRD